MKKGLFSILIAFCCFVSTSFGQSPVDDLFDKYSEKDGFTTVYITKYMFELFRGDQSEKDVKAGNEADEFMDVVSKLDEIKILTCDDAKINKNLNFYKSVMKELPRNEFKDLMVVSEKNNKVRFVIKEKGRVISELLMVVTSPTNNTIISITGEIDLKSISKISKSMKIKGLENLDKIKDKKK